MIERVKMLITEGHSVNSACKIVAEELGISPQTVNTKYYRSKKKEALQKLVDKIEELSEEDELEELLEEQEESFTPEKILPENFDEVELKVDPMIVSAEELRKSIELNSRSIIPTPAQKARTYPYYDEVSHTWICKTGTVIPACVRIK